MVRQSVLEKSKHLRFVFLGVFLGGVSRFELADLSILNDIGLMLVVIASLLFMLIYFIKRTVLPRQIGLTLFFFAVFVVWHVVLVIVYGVHERSILIILGLLIAGLVYVSASIF